MAKERPRLIPVWLCLLCIFIMGLFFYTRCRIECVKIGYEITRETDKQKRLNATKNALQIELEMLKSPEQIEQQVDRFKLGLKMPTPAQVIKIP